MNDQQAFEREVADWIAAEGAASVPGQILDDILAATGRKRPLPRWLALIKEPPMRISSNVAIGSPLARAAAVMVATLLLAGLLAGAGIAGSRLLAASGEIVVAQDGSGTTATIADALAMAEDGDTILVRPGTYDESLVVAKDVTIRGDGDRGSVIVEVSEEMAPFISCDAPDLPRAFVLDGSDATLADLTVRGESSMILILGGAPRLEGLVLDGIGRVYSVDPGSSCVPTGLDINGGSTATIMDSVLTDTDIDIEHASSPSIIGNEFSIGAIWMEGVGVDPLIQGNTIDAEAKWGVSAGGGAKPTIIGNTILNAMNGIELGSGGSQVADLESDAIVRDNTIIGSGMVGILVTEGAKASIKGNQLTDNPTGIMLTESDASVDDNTVSGGRVGIVIVRGSPSVTDNSVQGVGTRGVSIGAGAGPTLSGNTICDNPINLTVNDSADAVVEDDNTICEDAPTE